MSSFLRNIYFFPVSFYPLSSFLRILSPISRLFLVSCLLSYWIWILSLVSFFYPLRSFLRILSPNFHLLLSSGFFLEDSVSYLPLSFYTFFFLEGAGYYLLFLSSILFLLSWGFCLLSPIFYLLSCGFSLLSPFSILWFFSSLRIFSFLLLPSSSLSLLSWGFCFLSPVSFFYPLPSFLMILSLISFYPLSVFLRILSLFSVPSLPCQSFLFAFLSHSLCCLWFAIPPIPNPWRAIKCRRKKKLKH